MDAKQDAWGNDRKNLDKEVDKANKLEADRLKANESKLSNQTELNKKVDGAKFVRVKDAIGPEDRGYFSQYPFGELTIGEGFFVANEDTKRDTLEYMRNEIFRARNYFSIAEHDADGHEVQEEVHVKSRNIMNGRPETDGGGDPIYSAQSVLRPKLIYSRHFSAYPVTKDFEYAKGEKAPGDGVLVIREA